MKFTIENALFIKTLQTLVAAIGSRSHLPILSHLLLTLSDNQLSLVSTDLEIEMQAQLPVLNVESEGSITVPAKKLLDICRTFSNQAQITLTLEESRFLITENRNRFSIVTLPASDYPNLEQWQPLLTFSVAQSALKTLIESVQFSMANQDVRYYLNGLFLDIQKQQFTAVATDGHRLAVNTMALEQEQAAHSFILPRKGVSHLTKLLAPTEDLIHVELSSHHVRFRFEGLTLTSKLIDGRYPDYRRVLPANPTLFLNCPQAQLKSALTQAAILSNDKFQGVRFFLEQNQLKITAYNQEREEAEIFLDVDFPYPALEIGFNVSYLIELLNHLQADVVTFALTDAIASVQIQDSKNPNAIYILMPMRL